MIENCKKEIIELHQFFEDWFNARIPDNDESFSRLKDSLSKEFTMITPSGTKIDRSSLLSNLKSMNGYYLKEHRPVSLWIEHISHVWVNDRFCLSNYEEWQGNKDRTEAKGRISSALFKKQEDAHNKVRWVYLHETWIT